MAYDEQLAERIRELIAGERGVTEKRMFGGLRVLPTCMLGFATRQPGKS